MSEYEQKVKVEAAKLIKLAYKHLDPNEWAWCPVSWVYWQVYKVETVSSTDDSNKFPRIARVQSFPEDAQL